MLKAVFFDLDGTLLPMNEEEFTNAYFKYLCSIDACKKYDKEELIKVIWNGTKLMYQNDGSKSNEEVFWDYFQENFGKESLCDKEKFDKFYENEFKKTKELCKDNPLAREIVQFAKENVRYVILTTNPIFPRVATITRMGFVDLKLEDFDFVSTYENSRFCKPNPNYFQEILDMYSLNPDEVILFGNNDIEDYLCASKVGITCYLTGNLIEHKEKGIEFPFVKMEEIIDIIKKEIQKRTEGVIL